MRDVLSRRDTTGITPDVFLGAGAPAAALPAASRATPDEHRPLTLDGIAIPAGAQNHAFSWIFKDFQDFSKIQDFHRKIKVAKSV